MKKFEEEVIKNDGGFFVVHKNGKTTYEIQGLTSSPLIIFGDWVSPEDYQAEIAKIELQNLKYREEIARMQKALRKKNKSIKELNGAVKKSKARLKECEKLRIEANNEAAMEYSRKCEVVEERAELKRENAELKSQLEKQKLEIPEVPQFMDEWFKSDSLEDLIDVWYNHTSDLPENVKDYLDSLGEDVTTSEYCYKEIVHLIARAKLDGWTVAKEERFYLKNKLTKKFLAVRIGHEVERVKIGDYQEVRNLSLKNKELFKVAFTQQEIDSMETGSYEQIEVEEKA
ncbi:DUF1642 domain-containing protein [Lactococcus formosensis]|uniref:DUF1642 domain-containing protein n=1 Tax=Lactococcus formosensis TaxID=1281486 RepID=UPI00326695F7